MFAIINWYKDIVFDILGVDLQIYCSNFGNTPMLPAKLATAFIKLKKMARISQYDIIILNIEY